MSVQLPLHLLGNPIHKIVFPIKANQILIRGRFQKGFSLNLKLIGFKWILPFRFSRFLLLQLHHPQQGSVIVWYCVGSHTIPYYRYFGTVKLHFTFDLFIQIDPQHSLEFQFVLDLKIALFPKRIQ